MKSYILQQGDAKLELKPEEGYQDFVRRVATKFFPGHEEQWLQRYQFSLHFFGKRLERCQNCQSYEGVCPYSGHKTYLVLKKDTAVPVPYAEEALCPRYKAALQNQLDQLDLPEDEDREPDERTAPPSASPPTRASKERYEVVTLW